MLLAAITKASLTCSNAKVLPSPWGNGFDFLSCRPPLAHSNHRKERRRRRSLAQRHVFSTLLACGCKVTLAGMLRPSPTMRRLSGLCERWKRVVSTKKSRSTNKATCANTLGWSRCRLIAKCALRFVRAQRRTSSKVGGKGRQRAPKPAREDKNRLIYKSQDALRPFAMMTSLSVVYKQETFYFVQHIQAGESEFWKKPLQCNSIS